MAKKRIIKLKRKEGLYLKDSGGGKGRGVYCLTSIRKGEVLEVTPAIILNEAETRHVDKTILANYTFITGKISKRLRQKTGLKKIDDVSSLVMGIASFCNHTDHPNAEVIWEETTDTLYYSLVATRPIPKNTEICTGYGEGWFDDRD